MTMTRYFSVAAMLYCLLGPTPTAAAPIATGRQTIDINGTHIVVFTYRPAGCSDPTLLMVFHGIARNARSYRDYARPVADRVCLLIVAPVFDERVFPTWRYQRGGIVKDTAGADPRDRRRRAAAHLRAW